MEQTVRPGNARRALAAVVPLAFGRYADDGNIGVSNPLAPKASGKWRQCPVVPVPGFGGRFRLKCGGGLCRRTALWATGLDLWP